MNRKVSICILVSLIFFPFFSQGVVAKDFTGTFAKPERSDKRRGWPRDEIRLLMRSDILLRAGDPDIFSPLQPAVERFSDEFGMPASAHLLQRPPYDEQIVNLSPKRNDFTVIVANPEIGQHLITRGLVVPLDRFLKKSPHVISGIPLIGMQQFSRANRRYGIPLWNKGELLGHAYMVLRSARHRGMTIPAFKLIEFLKDEIPLSGRPDLIVDELSVKTTPVDPTGRPVASAGEITDADTAKILVMINAVISNVGEGPSEGFDVIISIGKDERFTTQQRVESLKPGATHKVIAEIEIPAPGGDITIDDLQPLNVDVDPLDGVLEANDLNNSLTRFHWNEEWIDLSPPDQPIAHNEPFVIDQPAYISSNTGMNPKVAFDGDNFLVVWARQDLETFNFYNIWNHTLRGKLIDQTGTTLQEFDIATTEGHYSHYNIGFNGTDYFVVWSRRFIQSNHIDPNAVIEGTAVTKQGAVLHDPPIVIEDRDLAGWPDRISHQSPDIIFDGNNFMVTYVSYIQEGDANFNEDPAGIYARQVTPVWSVSSQSVPIFTHDTLRSSYWAHQRTDFLDHKALLAFQGLRTDDIGGNAVEIGIYGVWMDIDSVSGTPSPDLPVLLDGDYDENHFPNGAYEYPAVQGAENAKFLNAWHSFHNFPANHSEIKRAFGQGLNSGGGYFHPNVAVTQGPEDRYPAIDYGGSMYTVTFQHLEGCKLYLAAVNVDKAGSVSDPTIFYDAGSLVYQADIAYGSQVGLIVYELKEYGVNGATGIWGQFITIPVDN